MDPSRSPSGTDLRDEGVGELVKRLAAETNTLVHQEIELAKAELTEKGETAGRGAAMFGGAGIVGLLALGALTACFIAVLATAVDHVWLAALIVTVVWSAASRSRRAPPRPPTTRPSSRARSWPEAPASTQAP